MFLLRMVKIRHNLDFTLTDLTFQRCLSHQVIDCSHGECYLKKKKKRHFSAVLDLKFNSMTYRLPVHSDLSLKFSSKLPDTWNVVTVKVVHSMVMAGDPLGWVLFQPCMHCKSHVLGNPFDWLLSPLYEEKQQVSSCHWDWGRNFHWTGREMYNMSCTTGDYLHGALSFLGCRCAIWRWERPCCSGKISLVSEQK